MYIKCEKRSASGLHGTKMFQEPISSNQHSRPIVFETIIAYSTSLCYQMPIKHRSYLPALPSPPAKSRQEFSDPCSKSERDDAVMTDICVSMPSQSTFRGEPASQPPTSDTKMHITSYSDWLKLSSASIGVERGARGRSCPLQVSPILYF